MASHVNTGVPRFGSAPIAKRVTAGAVKSASAVVKPVALDRGNVLRIRNGAGTLVRATSGVLWITEEKSPEDHVLLAGDALKLTQTGLAIVFAHRPARVVLEVPPGGVAPSAVDMALADGEPGRRITLARATPVSLSAMVRGLARVFSETGASIRTTAKLLASRWSAAHASTAGTNRSRKVEHVVTEEWSLWRK